MRTAVRVSNASRFYLRAIGSPVNSSQFCAIARNGIPIGNPNCKYLQSLIKEIVGFNQYNTHAVISLVSNGFKRESHFNHHPYTFTFTFVLIPGVLRNIAFEKLLDIS